MNKEIIIPNISTNIIGVDTTLPPPSKFLEIPMEEEKNSGIEILPKKERREYIVDEGKVIPEPVFKEKEIIIQNEDDTDGGINLPHPSPIGKNNEHLIDLPQYFKDMSTSRGSMSEMATHYYENNLTKADILSDPVMMEVIRSSLAARYDPSLLSRLGGVVSQGLGAATGGPAGLALPMASRDYYAMSDEGVFETWENWMRLFTSGNSTTVANEIVATLNASDEQRAQIGAGYHLMARRDNAIIGRDDLYNMADAIWDYSRSAIHDPTTLVTLGLGKFIFFQGQKATAEGLKQTIKGYYKTELTKNLAKGKSKLEARELARNSIMRVLARRETLGGIAAFTLPDVLQNIVVDYVYQLQLVQVGNQEELDKNSLAIIGLTSMLVPALATLNLGFKELRRSPLLKDTFLAHTDISNKIKLTGKQAKELIDERIKPNIPKMIDTIDEHFGAIKGDVTKLKAWEEAKEISRKELARNMKEDRTLQDLAHTQQFFREFFLDTKNAKGEVITKGYISALRDAGFIFHEDAIEKFKVSGVLGQTIEYLPDDVLKRIVKKYEDRTGKSLNLDGLEPNVTGRLGKSLSARYITTASDAGRFAQIASTAIQKINTQTNDMEKTIRIITNEIVGEDVTDVDPKKMQFLISIYKRLLTSHPATTGSNLKGFQALTLMDTAAEVATSAINVVQSGFYKTLGDRESATYFANQAYGNFLGAVRRGISVLSPDLEAKYAVIVADNFPKEKEKLFRQITGDGGEQEALKHFNMDSTTNPVFAGLDAITKGAQTVTLVRLQDELTKLWAFGNNVNANIMKIYGVPPSQFYARKDVGVEILSPKFQAEVLDKATFKTQRQTASVNWSALRETHGATWMREGAKFLETISGGRSKLAAATGVPVIIPFGSFMNTVLATFADYSGINALRFMVAKARNQKLDPAVQDTTEAIAKMAMAWGYVFHRTFYGENSAVNKVQNGIAFNEIVTPEGEKRNLEYDWPLNQFELSAQILAHGISGGGRNVPEDIKNLSPTELSSYVTNNFNLDNIPKELIERLASDLGLSAARQTDRVFQYVNEQIYELGTIETRSELGNFVLDQASTVMARVSQGASRSLETPDAVIGLLNNENKIIDLRQGNENYNTAIRYINNIIPEEVDILMGSGDLPQRFNVTKGGIKQDISKFLFGARKSPSSNALGRMLNSAALEDWRVVRWDGDPIIKNTMDKLAHPIADSLARKYLDKYVDKKTGRSKFWDMDLEQKRFIIEEEILPKLKSLTKGRLDALSPAYILLKEITSGNREARNFALESVGEKDSSFDDIMRKENAVEILQDIQYYMKNYKKLMGIKMENLVD